MSPDVSVRRLRVLRRVQLAAMVLKTEHIAQFQRSIEGGEGFFSETFSNQILTVAKREDEMGRAISRPRSTVA
jgi:hypothetical protein